MSDRQDWTGRRLELEVGAVAHGGHCVARHEGRVVFVRHALPGEIVVAEVTEDGGGAFCRADAVEVRQPAAGRVRPPCALADPALGRNRCGGCDWQHASGETQRDLKSAVVTEQLQRIAGLDWPVRVRELPGGLLRWRTRARLAVDRDGRAGFRAHRSHRVIPAPDCPITVEGAVGQVADQRWAPGAEVSVTSDAEQVLHLTVHEPRQQRGRGRRNVQFAQRRVQGAETATETAGGRSWQVDPNGFWQVHHAAADALVEVVNRMAAAPAGGVAWDLYGGVGLFAAGLAEQVGPAGSVLVVESSRRAVEHAVANLRDVPQVEFRAGTVEDVVVPGERDAPDVVVLDPPRKGAGRAVVEALTSYRPRRIVHVACDPAALARDVGLYMDHGYRLSELEAFDAFPMTHHVECVALLELERDS